MSAVTGVNSSSEAAGLPLEANQMCTFPPIWRWVSEVCLKAFLMFDVRPTGDLHGAYNDLNAKLCKAHALVYRLTAFKCVECPALVRGSNSTRVMGDKPESTQVLVVYYLLRELLKKQLLQCRPANTCDEIIVSAYLDAFEKFTAGVNLTKCVFTYLHWDWQKRGLPQEHTVLPTEILAIHLWTEMILDIFLKERLKSKTEEIIKAVRKQTISNIGDMEDVKRLSLSLLILHDPRQSHYVSIVEDPYLNTLESFYNVEKEAFKQSGPEEYIQICLREVAKEELRARCLLSPISYDKVRSRLTSLLIDQETAFLEPFAQEWLRPRDYVNPTVASNLTVINRLLRGRAKEEWLESVIGGNVVKTTQELVMKRRQQDPTGDVTVAALQAVKEAYHLYKNTVETIFGAGTPLLSAVLKGLQKVLPPNAAAIPETTPESVAQCLATFASEEVESFSDAAVGSKPEWITHIFRLLEKKDVFFARYTKLLETRLLKASLLFSTNDEYNEAFQREERMLSKLFITGVNFDSVECCERMVKDVFRNSVRIRDQYPQGAVKVSPLVLNRFTWSLLIPPSQQELLHLHPGIKEAVSRFSEFFIHTRTMGVGRQLAFLPQYSTAAVRMRISPSQSIQLKVSNRQLCIAFLFNEKKSWSVKEICERVGLTEGQCREAVDAFSSAGIFDVSTSREEVSVRQELSGLAPCGQLNLVPDVRYDTSRTFNEVDAGRSLVAPEGDKVYVAEALIVRHLKRDGPQTLEQVFAHILEAREQFSITRGEIKRALERLLDREFVKRERSGEFSYYA